MKKNTSKNIRACMKNLFCHLMGKLLQVALAMTLCLVLTAPVWMFMKIRASLNGKPVYQKQSIYGRWGRKLDVKLFNSSSWLFQQAALFPLVLEGILALVGVSIRNYDRLEKTDNDIILREKPGIFSLHFIRSSVRIVHSSRDEIDLEYIQNKNCKSDLAILVKSIPAMLYYQHPDTVYTELEVFGIKMLNMTMPEAIDIIDGRISQRIKSQIWFVNADCLNKTFQDEEYRSILRNGEIIFPDGLGVNLAGKMLGTPLRGNVNGTDMFPFLCELCRQNSYSMYLLGAGVGVAEAMKVAVLAKYPGLKINGVHDGFFNWEKEGTQVIDEINNCKPDMLLVAFGAPLQEKFISRYGNQIDASVMMGVGGLFDFYSGRIPRAPQWMRDIGMEWTFRLLQEPQRMWKRYILGNSLFLFRVFSSKLRKN